MKTVYQIRIEGFGKSNEKINTPWGTLKFVKEQLSRTVNSSSYSIGSVIFFELFTAEYIKGEYMSNPVLLKRGYVKIMSKTVYEK